jgi:hypothetical protein
MHVGAVDKVMLPKLGLISERRGKRVPNYANADLTEVFNHALHDHALKFVLK